MSGSTQHKGYLFPIRIVSEAASLGLALPDLQDMVQRSARFTHPNGNRRYHDYVFMVEGIRVTAFSKVDSTAPQVEPVEEETLEEEQAPYVHYRCDTCRDKRKIQVFNECPYCEGEGCKRCDDGLVPSSIPCPDCKTQKTVFKRKR